MSKETVKQLTPISLKDELHLRRKFKDLKAEDIQLKRDANELYNAIVCRKKILMWTYPKEKLSQGWHLQDLFDRASAAHTLGFDVTLQTTEKGIEVYYQATLPSSRPTSFW